MTEYEYTLSEPICIICLKTLINESAITNGTYQYSIFDESDNSLKVYYGTALSAGNKTILDDIVSNDLVWQTWEEKTRKKINAKTDSIILNDYVDGNGVKYKLDVEHQMSYKASHDERAGLTYPYKIKGIGSNYVEFADASEFHTWYLSAMNWVITQIQTGWALKDGLTVKTLQELKDWVDPR